MRGGACHVTPDLNYERRESLRKCANILLIDGMERRNGCTLTWWFTGSSGSRSLSITYEPSHAKGTLGVLG